MILIYVLTALLGGLLGLCSLIILPIIARSESVGKSYIWLAMICVKRGGIVVDENGGLNLKKLKYDGIGAEKVKISGQKITISDTGRRIKTLAGKEFAIVDEVHGSIFSIVDAIVGAQKRMLYSNDKMVSEATKQERNNYNVSAWVRRWIAIPTNTSVDLRDVRQLATGNERGVDSSRARTWYKYTKLKEKHKVSLLKHMVPVAAFGITLILLWQISIRSGGSGGTAAQNNSTVINSLFLVGIGTKFLHNRIVQIMILIGGIVGLWILSPFFAYVLLSFLIGFGIATGFTFLFVVIMGIVGIGAWLATTLFKLGLQCYDYPTLVETKDGYELHESDEKPETSHKFGRNYIAFEADESAVKERMDYADNPDNDKPVKSPTNKIDTIGLLKNKTSPNMLYVESAGALNALAHNFIGRDTDKRIQKSKEDYGGGFGVSDQTIVYATFGGIILAIVVGWLFFL